MTSVTVLTLLGRDGVHPLRQKRRYGTLAATRANGWKRYTSGREWANLSRSGFRPEKEPIPTGQREGAMRLAPKCCCSAEAGRATTSCGAFHVEEKVGELEIADL